MRGGESAPVEKDEQLRPHQPGANLVFLSARPESFKVALTASLFLLAGAESIKYIFKSYTLWLVPLRMGVSRDCITSALILVCGRPYTLLAP